MIIEPTNRGLVANPSNDLSFRAMMEASPQIVWTARPNGEFDYFNSHWLELTGQENTEEALRNGLRVALHPDDALAIVHAWDESVASGESFEREFQVRRASDGAYVWYLGRAVAVRSDITGSIERWLGVAADITAQKRETQETCLMLDHAIDGASRNQTFLREVLSGLTGGALHLCDGPNDLPPMRTRLVRGIALSADTFGRLRNDVRELAAELGFSDNNILDLCAAVSEAAMNALQHCGGGTVRVHTDDSNTLQVWIEDAGPTAYPARPLIEAHHDSDVESHDLNGHVGHGFAIMVAMVDRVWLLAEPDGTTVVLEQAADTQ